MSLPLPPNRLALFCKGFELPGLTGALAGAGLPEAAGTGHGQGWDWFTYEADRCEPDQLCGLAQQLPGWRHSELASGPAERETVFLASTPACACPHRQNLLVPHCPDHPFHFVHTTGGFADLFLNIGERRESRRGGTHPDELVGPLLAAGIVGRDTSRYDADPGFNADGRHTLALLAAHYGLPSPPLSGPAGNSSSP
ncbi:hypothetical protein ACFU5N_10710 [Streptomyces albidoflavus]